MSKIRRRRLAMLIGLLTALSGTPLRQAEAASDLGRVLAAGADEAWGTPDGGVGDDAHVATVSPAPAVDHAQDAPLFPAAPPPGVTPGPLAAPRGVAVPSRWPPPRSVRHARLQVFRF